MAAPETFVADVLGYWRADTVVGGSTPTSITDLSGNGRSLTASGVTVTSSTTAAGWGVASVPLLYFNGAATAYAAAAGPWKALHDGTGASLWAVLRSTSYTAQDVFLDTGVASSAYVGLGMWQDSTSGRLAISVTNGGGVSTVLTSYTWAGTFAVGVPHVLVVTVGTGDAPDIRVWLDGRLVAQMSYGDKARDGVGLSLSSADPTYPLRLGSLAPSGNAWVGHLGELGVTSSVMSTTVRQGIEAWAAEHYGVALNQSKRGQVVFDGNSLVDDSWRQSNRVFPEDIAADLRRQADASNHGVYGLRTQEMIDRYATHIRPLYDADREFNILVAWEIINELATGVPVATALSRYYSYCDTARADGWTVLLVPPLPYDGAVQADIEAVQADIIANYASHGDGIVRVDQDPTVGPWESRTDVTLRSDGVHFTAAGNAALVPWFVEAIDEVLADLPEPTMAQNYSILYSALLEEGTAEIAIGRGLVLNAAGTAFLPATSENRTATGRRSAGLARSSGDAQNRAIDIQLVGMVPASVSGLGSGTASPVRMSSAGWPERVASPSASDDVIGRCDADGTLYLTGGADFTVQVTVDGGVAPNGTSGQILTSNGASDFGTPITPPAGDLVGTSASQTLTNKTITYANNTLTGVTPTTRSVSTSGSLTGGGDLSADRTLSLVSDSASPGPSRYYGTDSGGTKGFHALPTGGATVAGSDKQVQYNNAGSLAGTGLLTIQSSGPRVTGNLDLVGTTTANSAWQSQSYNFNTTTDTPEQVLSYAVDDKTVARITLELLAIQSGGTALRSQVYCATFHRDDGGSGLVVVDAEPAAIYDAGALSIGGVEYTTSGNNAIINVTGIAGTTITWDTAVTIHYRSTS